MQGCRKRGMGGKPRAAAKLLWLCIVSTPPVHWRPPAALIPGWVGGNCKTTDWGVYTGQRGGGLNFPSLPPRPSSVKPVAEHGSRLMSSVPTMLITRLVKHSDNTKYANMLVFVLHCQMQNFFIEPPPDTQRKERQVVQYGRDAAHISWAAWVLKSLEDYMNERQHHLNEMWGLRVYMKYNHMV